MQGDRFATSISWIFWVSLSISIYTGFGNLPLYGRYYVADIPGLGWSRNFYSNLYVHYLSGAAILAVSTYYIADYQQHRSKVARITITGIVRASVMGLLLITGILSAIKNLPFVNLPHGGLMLLAFGHLCSALIFIFLSLGCKITKKTWLIHASRKH